MNKPPKHPNTLNKNYNSTYNQTNPIVIPITNHDVTPTPNQFVRPVKYFKFDKHNISNNLNQSDESTRLIPKFNKFNQDDIDHNQMIQLEQSRSYHMKYLGVMIIITISLGIIIMIVTKIIKTNHEKNNLR